MAPAPLLTIADRYQITGDPVGQGGMGIVYKAYDTVTRRHVAVKTMRGSFDASALELFSKEWTVLSRINHPNIVDLFDTGEFEENGQRKPFFVMPFLPGRTFDYLIKNASQRLTVERVTEIILQTCRGLQAAHENGLIHRDLKPSNIFVMEDDAVKIIDFGVVHLAGSDSVAGIKGTLQYMAPEQIEMKPMSPASDIFSLGVVCYEALTGRKPFARKSEAEVVEALRHHIPPPVTELNPLVSQTVSRVIHMAMAKAPYHRFSTAREFADTLQKALNNQTIERFDKSKTQPRIERARKAQAEGDLQFATDVLSELEAEGHIDPEMTVLRLQLNQAIRQKSIRQLLDSARTRREENEFPLALQKIQEVLDIDPDNADALSLRSDIERERSDSQIENWFRLVEKHVHLHSFAQARQALQEILKLDVNNGRAREMLLEIDRREQEISRLRAEKEQLYKAALSSYENGEISAALSKLERVLEVSRTAPDSAIPDRDAQYQGLYNQIRTERDAARNSYAEGRRCLADKNFDKALQICAEFLKRFPGDPLFQALKLEAEENRRQEHSSFIAEVNRRAEAEPDLDRRVNILKEAAERYPDEPHFQQSLRLIRDRRDLVNSIVAKARQYEDRGQFSEALGQWDILRNIYAQYPGIEFEVERLSRRREEQVRQEAKARWVEQIDRTLSGGDYARARDLVHTAMAEFPDDRELAGLERLSQQGLERAAEAESWLQRGQKLCFDREYGPGLEALQKAASLDSLNPVIRAALLNALVEQARSVLGQDWRAAEPLIDQALSIDGGHPLAKSLQGLVLDYKRQEIVNESVSQARELQAAGDLAGALSKVKEALQSFPTDGRLLQLRDTLQRALSAAEPPRQQATRPAQPVAPDTSARTSTTGGRTQQSRNSGISTVSPSFDRTALFPQQPPVEKRSSPPVIPTKPAPTQPRAGIGSKLSALRNTLAAKIPRGPLALPRFSRLQWGAFAAFPIIVLLALFYPHTPKRTPTALLPSDYAVMVDANVTGVDYKVDGKGVTVFPVRLRPGRHQVEANAVGYRTATQPFTVTSEAQNISLHLEPEFIRVRVLSDLKSGQVSIDDQPPVELQDGGFLYESASLSTDHKLSLTQSGKEYLSLSFRGDPGKIVSLVSPVKTSDLSAVVMSSLSSSSRLYSSNTALKAGTASLAPQAIPATGLEFNGLTPGSELVAVDTSNTSNVRPLPTEINNAPTLTLVLASDPTMATLRIESSVPDAQVTIEGRKPWQMKGTWTSRSLPPGKYNIHLTKEGFEPVDQIVELKKGAAVTLPRFDPKPVVRMAALTIDGGTQAAEVWIDGRQVQPLSAEGSFALSNLAPGNHAIELKKGGYEEKQIQRSFVAGQTLHLSAADVQLTQLGTIAFRVSPETARVTYQAEGEAQFHLVTAIGTVPVKAGRYQLKATAEGRKEVTSTIAVVAGRPSSFSPTLEPLEPAGPVADVGPKPVPPRGSEISESWRYGKDGWAVPKGSGFAWMRSNAGHFLLSIKRPSDKKLIIKRSGKIEWTADWVDQNNRIDYTLDQKNIERKVFVDGKAVKQPTSAKNPVSMTDADVWNLEIGITPAQIVISSNGKVLDEFARPDPSKSPGKFGFKGDVELKER